MVIEARLAACAIMLAVAAYFDLRSREVEDWLWVIFGVVGLSFTGYEFFTGFSPNLFLYLISFAFTFGLAYLLYFLGFYGGADAKALATISLLVPIFSPTATIHPITGLIILTNSSILTIILPLYYGATNLARIAKRERIFEGLESESLRKKILASFLGYRTKSGKGKFLLRLEKTVDGKRKLDISMSAIDEEFVSESGVWVTPGIPLLLFMAIGFVVMVLFGDILALLLRFIFNIG